MLSTLKDDGRLCAIYYVADIVDTNRTLLDSDAADGNVLNIWSSDNISIQELAETVRNQLAPERGIEYESAREADTEHMHASAENADEVMGTSPRGRSRRASASSSSGIRRTASGTSRWYENRS